MALAVAMVACSAAAGKPGEPGKAGEPGKPPNLKPTVKMEIPDQALVLGAAASKIDLSKVFTDPDSNKAPSFTAISGDVKIVTAMVMSGMLELKPVKVGKTTVTATATDAGGLRTSDTFNVMVAVAPPTVPVPETGAVTSCTQIRVVDAKPKPDTLDISKCLPTGADASMYELESTDDNVFSVEPKDGAKYVWKIMAVSRGMADAEIRSVVDGKIAKTIPVTINNRTPKRKPDSGEPGHASPMGPMAHSKLLTANRDSTKVSLYYVEIHPGTYFTDDDADDVEMLEYSIASSSRDILVREGGTCKESTCKVWIDFLKVLTAQEFNLRVRAKDPKKATSVLLNFPVDVLEPAMQMYTVTQPASNHLRRIHVGNRRGVDHMMTFDDWDVANGGVSGFRFAQAYLAKELMTYDTKPPATDIDAPVVVTEKPTDGVQATGGKDVAIMVERTGRVKTAELDSTTLVAETSPKIDFSVSGTGSGGVKITLYILAAKASSAAITARKWMPVTRTLAVNVVAVK